MKTLEEQNEELRAHLVALVNCLKDLKRSIQAQITYYNKVISKDVGK